MTNIGPDSKRAARTGRDLRKVPRTDSYEFGFLPPRLFNQVRDAFVAFHKAGQAKTTHMKVFNRDGNYWE
jgi:hypothetical protein